MDIATLLGVFGGIFFIMLPILNGASPMSFIDIDSIMITVGGGIGATLISYRMHEITKLVKVAAQAFVSKKTSPINTINLLIQLSQKARKEGLLALEADLETLNDDFIKQYLQLIVDGIDPDVIRKSMELEIENMMMRHERGQGLFKLMASQFPAWGMIGTLIGLIQLLESLETPESIGPSMAVALVTTFYGVILANFVCNPIANKLAIKSEEEIQEKEMIIEGILSIQAGENPRILEQKLSTFLSPDQKLLLIDKEKEIGENIGNLDTEKQYSI